MWLKANNYLYCDIIINNSLLDFFVPEGTLPIHIEHVSPSRDTEGVLSRYHQQDDGSDEVDDGFLESVLISDVDVHASPNELRAAALRHFSSGGRFLQLP